MCTCEEGELLCGVCVHACVCEQARNTCAHVRAASQHESFSFQVFLSVPEYFISPGINFCLKNLSLRGVWVAQLVKPPALDLGSSHDLTLVHGIEP